MTEVEKQQGQEASPAPAVSAGDKLQEQLQELNDKFEQKLQQAKKEWAEQAKQDPDAARRELRAFWGCVAALTACVGFACGWAAHGLL